MNIPELIDKAKKKRISFLKNNPEESRTLPPSSFGQGIPTLQEGIYQGFTPQLKARYGSFGRWETATHGHWLGIHDMEALWNDAISEEILSRIKQMRIAGEKGWPNEASALFRTDRLSLFACSDLTNEKIYLLWLEFEEEPELWVYDSNGESRYKDLASYLAAYLTDDVSASERRWIIAEAERFGA